MSRQHPVRFPDELHERIEALARSQDRSFAYMVVKACEEKYPGALGKVPERVGSGEPRTPASVPGRGSTPRPSASSRASGRVHSATCKCPMCRPVKG